MGSGGGVGLFRLGAEQLAEVIGQDLGGEVLLKGEIAEPAGRIEAQTMLDPLEGLRDLRGRSFVLVPVEDRRHFF